MRWKRHDVESLPRNVIRLIDGTKLTTILALCGLAPCLFSQGTISIVNGSYSLARTNASGIGGTVGYTSTTLGGFYYGVFSASSMITSVDPSLQDLLSTKWTFTGVYATNTFGIAGRFTGGVNVTTLHGWEPGVTNSYLLVGWSSSIAGRDWNAVSGQLAGASLQNGVWKGPNWRVASDGGFIGVTEIGFGEAGGWFQGNPLPPLALFGTTETPQGIPIGSPFDMFVVGADPGAVPEPSAYALLSLATTALVIRRRRNRTL